MNLKDRLDASNKFLKDGESFEIYPPISLKTRLLAIWYLLTWKTVSIAMCKRRIVCTGMVVYNEDCKAIVNGFHFDRSKKMSKYSYIEKLYSEDNPSPKGYIMTKLDHEDSSCSCHVHPPCSHCMNTCGECGKYREEGSEICNNCNLIKLRFLRKVINSHNHTRTSSAHLTFKKMGTRIYLDTPIHKETLEAITMLDNAIEELKDE